MQILTDAEIEEFAGIERGTGTPQEREARLVAFLAKRNGGTIQLPSCFIKNCYTLKALFQKERVVIGVNGDIMYSWYDLALITHFSLEVQVVISLADLPVVISLAEQTAKRSD